MFILGLVLAAVAVIALLVAISGKLPQPRNAWLTFAGSLVAAVGLIGASCITVVPTRNVGIVTAWNKPTGRTTGAGASPLVTSTEPSGSKDAKIEVMAPLICGLTRRSTKTSKRDLPSTSR